MNAQMVITLLMMLVIIVLLVKGVAGPGTIFLITPIAASVIMGYSFKDINSFISSGMKSVGSSLFLMVVAVLYFSILHEAGVFKAMVRFVMRFLGNSVAGTLIVTVLISFLTQLDGSGATTALCTIPTMRPVFEKQKIRRETLLLVESLASGIFCLLPWAPGLVEASAYVEVDPFEVFRYLVPLIVFAVFLLFLFCIPLSWLEKKRGAGLNNEEFNRMKEELAEKLELPFGCNVAIFDGVLTILLMAGMLAGILPANLAFAVGYPILLFVNYRSNDKQRDYMKRQAPMALNLAYTMLGVAVLVGVNNGTGALSELAVWMSENVSHKLLAQVPLLLCVFSVPLSITLGSSKNSGILPAIIPIVMEFGFTPIQVVGAVFATGVISANLNLFNAAPYLALGLAGVEMKDHLKYSLLPVIGFSLIMTGFLVISGML